MHICILHKAKLMVSHGGVTAVGFLCQLTGATPGIFLNQLHKAFLIHYNWPYQPRLLLEVNASGYMLRRRAALIDGDAPSNQTTLNERPILRGRAYSVP